MKSFCKGLIIICIALIFSSCIKYYKFQDLYIFVNNLPTRLILQLNNKQKEYITNNDYILSNNQNSIVARLESKTYFDDGDEYIIYLDIIFEKDNSFSKFIFYSESYLYQLDTSLTTNIDGYIDNSNYLGYSENIYVENSSKESMNSNCKSAVQNLMRTLKVFLNKKGFSMMSLNFTKF